jgi:hypothetical protein
VREKRMKRIKKMEGGREERRKEGGREGGRREGGKG